MSDLDSWEDDPAAQEDNLSKQAQLMNLNHDPQRSSFRLTANSFQPGAQSFQPGLGQVFEGKNIFH
jgi:peptide chain release factor subunit 3